MIKYTLFLVVPLLLLSCKHSEEFTGFSYDPPDVTNTTDKAIIPQPRRIIGSGMPRVWVSNEFDGARLNDFFAVNDSTFEAFIKPENAPINNSPWFAFKIWSDTSRDIQLRLNYKNGEHRYIPKINRKSGNSWKIAKEASFHYDSTTGTALVNLKVSPDTLLLSAQKLYTTDVLENELREQKIISRPFVTQKQVGTSKQGRPVNEIEINEVDEAGKAPVLVIISRQHPPEVSGFLASMIFLEEITSDSELAARFRDTFVVKAYPLLNPDGVDNGHWRHNAGGVDLNRDWVNFNQPETKAVRDALLPLKEDSLRQVYYGIDFHSTNENIFYPINRDIQTTPDNFTQRWIQEIIAQNPDVNFAVEEFDTSSPIAKNWLYRAFGADAITFELHDELDSDTLETVSRSAATLLMQFLLDEWNKRP